MGCGSSKQSAIADPARLQSERIDRELEESRVTDRREIRMLLLGAGESGKSTILKQMRIVHNGGFTLNDRAFYREIIISNTITSMKTILLAMDELLIELEPENEPYRDLIRSMPANLDAPFLPPEIHQAITRLKTDRGVEEALFRNNEYQLNDSSLYFFEATQRMSQPGYIPTDQDILRSRVKTSGITELSFPVKDKMYKVYDVGGQRSERRKWIHCFENLDAVIFMVAMSEYDQVLREDEQVNRMQESLVLYKSICKSPWFQQTAMILFLNKMDLLAEKLSRAPVSLYLRDYDGSNDYDSVVSYFRKTFVRCNRNKQTYVHVTCATDTHQITFVLLAMHDILLKHHLVQGGFL